MNDQTNSHSAAFSSSLKGAGLIPAHRRETKLETSRRPISLY
jgi:hypothetical protein